jgi:hypothetical protein
MPAREMFFTFDTKVKVNKNSVLQFVEEYRYYIEESFQQIKAEFDVSGINQDFLRKFIKELKNFNSVNVDSLYGKEKIVYDFIIDIVGEEEREGDGLLKVRYLYDEWEYEGCGRDNHYYYTFTDDKKMIKKTIKETQKLVDKLNHLGCKTKLLIEDEKT